MPQIAQLSLVFASQLFWLVISFGLIFSLVGRRMLPKVRSTIVARTDKIADDLEKAKAAQAEAEQTEARWRERMDHAKLEATRIAQEAKREGARETEARVKAALDEIDAKVEHARLRIRTAVDAARTELEAVAVEVAQEMVGQLTGLRIDRKDAERALAAELEVSGASAAAKQRRTSVEAR
jgi:F-type H+-transporting ATPase subunit b